MTHHNRFSGLTAALVLLVALVIGGSAVSLEAQQNVQTARADSGTVSVEADSSPISDPDMLQVIQQARANLDPSSLRYDLPADFVPYASGAVNLAPASPALEGRNGVTGPALVRRGTVTAVVIFDGTSAVEQVQPSDLPNDTASQAAVGRASEQVRAGQAATVGTLQSTFNADVVAQLSHVLNGVIINVDASQISAIEELPGVEAVYLDTVAELNNASSVPFIGAVSSWRSGTTGFTGTNMDIGVIDSGIDYLHTNMGGPGTGYGSADTTTIDGSEYNAKVVGGGDYVGDGWTAGASLSFDPDPWDCNGHGSHVAGTAGGYGVNGDGTIYTGAYNAPIDFASLRIGPGVAPGSRLHALKIGDCSPSVSFAAAINAIDNYVIPEALDVTSNSYGGGFGTPLEPLVIAYERASDAGVLMVGSAGNSGDTYYVNGDPNIANSAISTASSVSDVAYQGLAVTDLGSGTTSTEPASASVNGADAIPPVGPMSLIPIGGTGGCTPGDYAGFTPGAAEAAVIRWTDGTCGSVTRMTNAVNNGNVDGLAVITDDPADAPFILLSCGDASGGPVTTAPIPCVSLQGSADYLYTNPGDYTVTFDGTLTAFLTDSYADNVSGFTSRGPRMGAGGTVLVKPDVAAPGDLIFSTAAGTGNEGVFLGGTSMAGPHVAGMGALLAEAFPTYSVQQLKARIMNTANNDLWTDINQTGDNYSPSRIGTGRVDIQAALNARGIAYSTDNPEGVSVSFGQFEVAAAGERAQTITIRNTTDVAQTFNVDYESYLDMNGADVTVRPTLLDMNPGEVATVRVVLRYDPALMDENGLVDPTMSSTQSTGFGALPRVWHREEAGYVKFTGAGPELRVTVHAMPRPAGQRSVATNPISTGVTGSTLVDISGPGVDTSGSLTTDQYSVVSQVSGFNALYTLPNDAITGPERDRGDIQHVGISSDYQAQLALAGGNVATAVGNTTIFIGFSTYGEWSTHQPYDLLYDFYFDPEEDGTFQVNVFNWDGAALFGLGNTDTPLNLLYVSGPFAGSGSFNNGFLATNDMYAFNNNVVMVPIPATWLGLSDTNTDFQFDFATQVDLTGYYDFTPTIQYDITTDEVYNFNDASGTVGGPFPGVPTWFDLDPFALPVDYDFSVFPPTTAPMLLLHHHNDNVATRPELVFFDQPTLVLSKTASPTSVAPGDNVTFTITLENQGPGDVTTDHVLIDTMPASMTYISDTCPTTSIITDNTLECVIPATIAAGTTVSMDVVMRMNTDVSAIENVTNVVQLAPVLARSVVLETAQVQLQAITPLPTEIPIEGGPGAAGDGGVDLDGDGIPDAQELPATGESPWWRDTLLLLLAAGTALTLSAMGAGSWLARRSD